MGGHRHSHHLPKSFWSNSSHGQSSNTDPCVSRALEMPWARLPSHSPAASTAPSQHSSRSFQGCQPVQTQGSPTAHSFSSTATAAQNFTRAPASVPGLLGSLDGLGHSPRKVLEAESHLEELYPNLQETSLQLAFLLSQKTRKRVEETTGKPIGVQTIVYSVLHTLGFCQHRTTGSFSPL